MSESDIITEPWLILSLSVFEQDRGGTTALGRGGEVKHGFLTQVDCRNVDTRHKGTERHLTYTLNISSLHVIKHRHKWTERSLT